MKAESLLVADLPPVLPHNLTWRLGQFSNVIVQVLNGSLVLLFVWFFIQRAYICLTDPYLASYGEGTVLYEASRIASGHALYTSNLTSPYQIVNYGPLGYYFDAATLLGAANPNFTGGRWLSLLAVLLACWCIYLVARTKLKVLPAVGAALTPLATGPVFGSTPLYKPDMLAIAFSLAGATLVYRQLEQRDPNFLQQKLAFKDTWFIYAAALLCVLALFVKQSALAAPLAIFVYLGLRSYRQALLFAVTGLVSGTVLFAFFDWVAQGQLWQHLVSYNAQHFQMQRLITYLEYMARTYPILEVLCLLYIIWWGVRGKSVKERVGMWQVYWIVALALSFSIGKVGSNLNYFIELMFVSSVLAWWLAYEWLNSSFSLKLGAIKVPLALLGIVLLIAQFGLLLFVNEPNDELWGTPNQAEIEQYQKIENVLQQFDTKGPILLEDVGWLRSWQITTAMDDSFGFRQLLDDKQWDQSGFLQELKNGYYKVIVLDMWVGNRTTEKTLDREVNTGIWDIRPDRFSPEMDKLFHTHFKVARRVGKTIFLTWQP